MSIILIAHTALHIMCNIQCYSSMHKSHRPQLHVAVLIQHVPVMLATRNLHIGIASVFRCKGRAQSDFL